MTKKYKKIGVFFLFSLGLIVTTQTSYADQDLISLFPLSHYDQSISTWINPADTDYDKLLLNTETRQKRLDEFQDHYFGSLSPWSPNYVNQILQQTAPNNLKTIEQNIIQDFNNEGKTDKQIGYGVNFRPYAKDWIEEIENNINISQLDNLTFQINNRGIAITNLHARVLPTDDVYFYNYKLAGQGYPFDNLQMSALWAGTPVYILGETRDHAWMLVIAPDYIAWVKSSGIARTDNAFVTAWTKAAKNQLIAITHTKTSVVDEKGKFLFSAFVSSVFPGNRDSTGIKMMVPVADTDGNAVIKSANISAEYAALMPVPATPHNFAKVISTLITRPYGWGSIYFYNDCSAELKSLLTPFGIWLPRHSSSQVTAGKMVDMTSASPEKRLSYLIENGHRFLTIVYIGGHVVMYIGNYHNPNSNNSLMAMTYQNMWGLSPNPSIRRAVIGKSVFFPMLLQYPEDTNLISLANEKYFQISFLDELPSFDFPMKEKMIDLKLLMFNAKA